MKQQYKRQWLLVTIVILLMQGCGKNFLELKPNQQQKVPTTIADFRAILDNATGYINPVNNRSSHTLGIIGADEYEIPPAVYGTFPVGLTFDYQKNAYGWNERVYQGGEGGIVIPTDFDMGYQRVLLANLVLEGLGNIKPNVAEEEQWNDTKGTALFHRAWNYYCLLQLYAPVYNTVTASSDLGMPLRLESDPTARVPRASVEDCYQFLIKDLKEAVSLLPDRTVVKFRPTKQAVWALLARVYLQLEDYDAAAEHATNCMNVGRELLDYNNRTVHTYPFPIYGTENTEVIFVMTAYDALAYTGEYLAIPVDIYRSYDDADLRKTLFFEQDNNSNIRYRGSYYGSSLLFTGLALDEVYLTRAESNVRLGNLTEALADLNLLLRNRYRKDAFVNLTIQNEDELLSRILKERKKQLLLRGIRWEDLRRLNKNPKTATMLKRNIAGRGVELQPNSLRYVWPFPEEAITVGGYPQNPR
ncbi:RagB/SusD family nutrient uptake outer membrane protein [Sphingobacterium tabacisoli]|uniref:RagB/SusD family nutrient uptake outer membrane protein n=1 Tax=Sphingobacterium tabacisoli TaxID=2044855 RepID=A0ABW5L3G8_9SPHI|nr:RagB/SusD family nutrient uptake outer membrane protein [Sphingobacterium tabacisoli]